jgi:hypothetical protein
MAVMGGWWLTCSATSWVEEEEEGSVQWARKSSPKKALRGLRIEVVGGFLVLGLGLVVGEGEGEKSTPV